MMSLKNFAMRLVAVVVVTVVVADVPLYAQSLHSVTASSSENPFCGPQAVRRVLNSFGQDVELSELVREIQWPEYQKGSSLASLAEALESRGIQTRAVEMDPKAEISWGHPVIVHLARRDEAHYVVWLPPEKPGEAPRYWDASLRPPFGWRGFATARTGIVLLTSDQPIPEQPTVGRRASGPKVGSSRRSYLMAMNLIFLGAVTGFLLPRLGQAQKTGG